MVPPEILSEILYKHAQGCWHAYESAPWDDGSQFPYCWLSAAHVCVQWRNAALADSRLWAWIVPLSPECTETFLLRSARRPLTIIHTRRHVFVCGSPQTIPEQQQRLRRDEDIEEALICFVVPHFDRVERIDLYADFPLGLPYNAFTDIPLLKSLTLRSGLESSVPHEEESEGVLASLVKRSLPSLTELHSWSDPANLAPLIRPNLTSLTLSAKHMPRGHNGASLLIILQKTPRLQHLRVDLVDLLLNAAHFTEDALPQAITSRASLPDLASIHLNDERRGIPSLMLLRTLTFPTATVSLRVTTRRADGRVTRGLLRVLDDLGGAYAPIKLSTCFRRCSPFHPLS